MSALALIMALAIPISIVMIAIVYVGRRQQEALFRHNQAILIHQKADEILESIEFLYLIEEPDTLHECLLNRVAELHQKAFDLEPEAPEGEEKKQHFNKILWLEQLDIPEVTKHACRSDGELRTAKSHISRLLKVLSSMKKVKIITGGTYQEYRLQLRTKLLDLQVNTYLEQGKLAKERDDTAAAADYFKVAKKHLVEFDLQYPQKNDLIREINELTSNLFKSPEEIAAQRDALSAGIDRESEAEIEMESGLPSSGKSTGTAKKKF